MTGIEYHLPNWEPYVKQLAGDLNRSFVMKFIEVESGGNPCARGNPDALGPDGNPREMGLGQLYNPDDFIKLGFHQTDFRSYCVPGTSQCSRVLTDGEMVEQVKAVVVLIGRCRESAAKDLAKVEGHWDNHSFYALVKMEHALPGLAHSGLPAASHVLGRAPSDFNEWRETLAKLSPSVLDAGTRGYMHDGTEQKNPVAFCGMSPNFVRMFRNASETASVVS